MKIGEAQKIYREQIKSYRLKKSNVSKQLQNLRSRMERTPGGQEKYASEAATLELTLNALDEKQNEYQDYLSELSEQYCAYWNAAVADQQKDAARDYAADMGKIMEVARRIMRGAIVPAADEKKLMHGNVSDSEKCRRHGPETEAGKIRFSLGRRGGAGRSRSRRGGRECGSLFGGARSDGCRHSGGICQRTGKQFGIAPFSRVPDIV